MPDTQKTYWEICLEMLEEVNVQCEELPTYVKELPFKPTQRDLETLQAQYLDPNASITVGQFIHDFSMLITEIKTCDIETMSMVILPRNYQLTFKNALITLVNAIKNLHLHLSPAYKDYAQLPNKELDTILQVAITEQGNTWRRPSNNTDIKNLFLVSLDGYEKTWIEFRNIMLLLEKLSPLLYSTFQEGKQNYISELQSLNTKTKNLFNTLANHEKNIKAQTGEIATLAKEATTAHSQALSDSKDITTWLKQSQEEKKSLDLLVQDNKKIMDELNATQARLKDFDDDLEQKEKRFKAAQDTLKKMQDGYDASIKAAKTTLENVQFNIKKDHDDLLTAFNSQNEQYTLKIEKTIETANSMLAGVTNTVLGTSFHTLKEETKQQLDRAMKRYYWAVVCCFGGLVPIAFAIYNSLFRSLSPFVFLACALFAMPGFLFLHFATTRHADLSRVYQDYAYKYSIAVGVAGYQQAAPMYEEEIAAATFGEITFNPGDHLKGQSETKLFTHPLMEPLIEKLSFFLGKGTSEEKFTQYVMQLAARKFGLPEESIVKLKELIGDFLSEETVPPAQMPEETAMKVDKA